MRNLITKLRAALRRNNQKRPMTYQDYLHKFGRCTKQRLGYNCHGRPNEHIE